MKDKIKSFIKSHRKSLIIAVSSTLAAALVVGGTIAYLIAQPVKVVNTFTKGTISCEIVENFKSNVKENVRIHNTGSAEAFIRVKLVPSWENDAGDAVARSASLDDFDIKWDASKDNWIDGKDGYFYFKTKVNPDDHDDTNFNDCTSVLIDKATVKDASGMKMNLNVLAEAIQCSPDDAVSDSWKAVKVGSDGKLEASR